MKTKLFSLFGALLATTALWSYDFKYGDLYYNITSSSEKTAEVTRQDPDYESHVNYKGLTSANIPATVTYNGTTYSVTSIGEWAFSYCKGLTSVTIPESVTSIGEWAFSYCKGLTSVTIGNSVTSIGYYAFYGCTGLTSVTIPNSVTSIGGYAFSGCTRLTSVTIGNSVTSIGYYAFEGCTSLTSVTIGNSVTRIESSAFSGCTGLTSITIPNSVTSLSGFEGCTGLTSITIPESVTSIGDDAFRGCTGLTSVTIGNSVTRIESSAFRGCTGLTSVTIGNSVTRIESSAFSGCTRLTSVTIGNSVTSIGWSAFKGCTGLTSITIPESVTSIGDDAFRGCTGLTSVEWNAKSCKVDGSDNSPFDDIRSQITSFTFGDAVDAIPAYLCYYMEKLTSITIPNSVTSIGKNAFYGCTGLTSVVWNAKSCKVDGKNNSPFYNGSCSKITSFTFGDAVDAIPAYLCYEQKELTSIIVDKNNSTYDSRDSCNALIETKTNTLLIGCKNTIIPNTIATIADSAFYSNHSRSITIPASVTRIGTGAFGNGYGIDTLYLLPETPPAISNKDLGFDNDYYGMYYSSPILYIPCGTKQAYKYAAGWSRFSDKNIVEPSPQYTIAVKTQNSSQGTASVKQANLCNNDNATIIAEPNFGYQFAQWSDGSTENPYTVEVTQDTTLTAVFALTTIGECGKSLTWEYSASKLRIVGTGDMYSYAESEVPWRLLRDSITEVEIAGEVTSISSYAFRNCKNLTKITFPADLTSMGKFVLDGCTALTSVIWNVKNMADYYYYNTPFYYSYSSSDNFDLRPQITSFTFGDKVENIPAYLCRGMENLTSITLPNSVTSIGNSAFSDCKGLTSAFIGNGVTSIGNYAFSGCAALSSVTMGNSVKTIGNYAFDGCEELLTMLIPNSITTIGEYAFRGCKNMETISFGAGLTSMGDYALDGCQSIYEMTCYATKVPTVSSNTFREVSTRADLYVPSVSVKKYKTHAYWGVFNILSIGADPVSSGGSVTVRPGENDVIITWPTDDNADTYAIQITKDGQVFCTLVFNADGQLTNIAFAPARNGEQRHAPAAVLTQSGYRFKVTGLTCGTRYAYDLTVKDYDENILQSYTGTFTTKGENITTDLDNVEDSGPNSDTLNGDDLQGNNTPRKVFRDGQVYILRGGKTYTLTGVEVK